MANGRSAYSGLSPARPPIAAGGGGNIVEFGCRRCRGLERRGRGGCQGISGRGREEAAAAAAAAGRAARGGSRGKEKERKEEGGESSEEEAGPAELLTSRRRRRRRRAAGGRGGGAAPCPRSSQRSRPPTRWSRAAAKATRAGAVGRAAAAEAAAEAGVGAEATAMAFLKLRDQVGEGLQGGIAPSGKERKQDGPAGWAAWAPARRGGCEGNGGPDPGTGARRLAGVRGRPACQSRRGPGEAHVPPGV